MIEKFEPRMIERFLNDRGYRYQIDHPGTYHVDSADIRRAEQMAQEGEPHFLLEVAAEGSDGGIASISIWSADVYPEEMRSRANEFAASWNRRAPLPTASVEDHADGVGLVVVGTTAFPLAEGVTQELLDHFIFFTVIAGDAMLSELDRLLGTPGRN